jgi:deoxyribonuclease-1
MKVYFLYDKFILQLQQTVYFSNISETIMKLSRILLIICGCCWLVAHPLSADQTRTPNYETARPLFWSQIYARGGKTLYCEQNFGAHKNFGINIEHIFPMGWVTRELGCGTRNQCRAGSERFNHIEADLHNMYPALTDINDTRGSLRFGMIKGELRRFGACDFEVERGAVEPRDGARGEIARAMFYMAEEYGLTIFKKQAEMLKEWHFRDQPSKEEKRRNDIIEQIQGTRNLFIDDPELVNALEF